MNGSTTSAKPFLFGVAGVLIGALMVGPVGAHVRKDFGHLWKTHIKPKLAKPGDINKAKNPVNWTKLKGVPPGLRTASTTVIPARAATSRALRRVLD